MIEGIFFRSRFTYQERLRKKFHLTQSFGLLLSSIYKLNSSFFSDEYNSLLSTDCSFRINAKGSFLTISNEKSGKDVVTPMFHVQYKLFTMKRERNSYTPVVTRVFLVLHLWTYKFYPQG